MFNWHLIVLLEVLVASSVVLGVILLVRVARKSYLSTRAEGRLESAPGKTKRK